MSARDALRALAADSPITHGEVRLRVDGDTAWLELDHRRARNAMSLRMMIQLAKAVDELEGFAGSAVVVRGLHGAFCSGGHLSEVRTALTTPGGALAMTRVMTHALARLRGLPCVVVAALDGVAMGGGAELVVACDRVVMGPSGRLHFVHATLGVAPGWGGAAWLAAHIGHGAALDLMLRGQALNGESARAVGLPIEVHQASALEGVQALLSRLQSVPVATTRAIKSQLVSARPPVDVQGQCQAFLEVWGGLAHREALDQSPIGRSN